MQFKLYKLIYLKNVGDNTDCFLRSATGFGRTEIGAQILINLPKKTHKASHKIKSNTHDVYFKVNI